MKNMHTPTRKQKNKTTKAKLNKREQQPKTPKGTAWTGGKARPSLQYAILRYTNFLGRVAVSCVTLGPFNNKCRRLGASAFHAAPNTGKSFRFVRACVRARDQGSLLGGRVENSSSLGRSVCFFPAFAFCFLLCVFFFITSDNCRQVGNDLQMLLLKDYVANKSCNLDLH